MKKISAMAFLLAAGTSICLAQTQGSFDLAPGDDVRVGLGVACDTEQQIERYTKLIGATEAVEAIQIVNKEAQNPRACGAVAIAYKVNKQISNVRNEKGTFRIVEIVVIAATGDGGGWQMVNPHPTQYIALQEVEA